MLLKRELLAHINRAPQPNLIPESTATSSLRWRFSCCLTWVRIAALLKHDPKINILVVSALSDKSTAIAALKLGARGFVAKPFTDEELQMALLDVSDSR